MRAAGLVLLALTLPLVLWQVSVAFRDVDVWRALHDRQYAVSDRVLIALSNVEWRRVGHALGRYGGRILGAGAGLYLWFRPSWRLVGGRPKERNE